MRRHDAARIPQDLLSPDVEAAYVASRRVGCHHFPRVFLPSAVRSLLSASRDKPA